MLNPDQWLAAHGNVLYGYALKRLRNAELAEDAVQEALVAGLKALGTFDGRSSERTWLVGILRHKIVDQMRRKWREQPVSEVSGEAGDEAFFTAMFTKHGHWRGSAAPAWGNPRTPVEEADFQAALGKCLAGLPGRLADAFVLREVEMLDGEEVCKVLGITPTNFWAMMHRARTRLRACLNVSWFGQGKGGGVL